MRISKCVLASLALASLVALPVRAEDGSQRAGDYVVHYNALPTAALSPAMASQYAITRSPRHGMLNVSVRRLGADASDTALAARIEGMATTLTGAKVPVTIREIAGTEVSYIGLFEFDPPDTLTFELKVTPQGSTQAIALRYNHDFTAE